MTVTRCEGLGGLAWPAHYETNFQNAISVKTAPLIRGRPHASNGKPSGSL